MDKKFELSNLVYYKLKSTHELIGSDSPFEYENTFEEETLEAINDIIYSCMSLIETMQTKSKKDGVQ